MADRDRDRSQILARRRLFVASALAGVVVAGCDQIAPKPCLEPPPVDAGATPPTPCLAQQLADAEPAPRPCLEPMPRPTTGEEPGPKVCLRVAAPRNDGGPADER